MPLRESLLYRLCKMIPSPVAERTKRFGGDPASDEYGIAYATAQFDQCVQQGLGIGVRDKTVLEIGCGHGGFTCYCALNGAQRAIGLDLDDQRLVHAERFTRRMTEHLGVAHLPVEWLCASASQTGLPDNSVDLIYAPNVFEHFDDPAAVMAESYRILKPEGVLYVPVFVSILSRYGIHLKHAITLPNANLFFSEQTIVRVAQRLANERPQLHAVYPGLATAKTRIRETRKYGDLNGITNAAFKRMAREAGFKIESCRSQCRRMGKLVLRIPGLSRTRAADILSTGTAATLRKAPAKA